jgi:hypothetical protein
VKYSLLTHGIDLEDRSRTLVAPVIGRAVQVAMRIPDDSRLGTPTVGGARETVEDSLFAGQVNLKHRSGKSRATLVCGAVKVAHSTVFLPVGSTLNTVPALLGPSF